ncbi:hypothetical protein GCM10022297_15970 [Lactobacillus hamsteri]|uniref:Uncharacterized protein n=2 Tax=Lactobacillus hamsteri TaxID=96565 RepID=A0A0R1YDV3_9LACO|nr:hypothetical protein [Lactobacillus hamsteri]KRM37702.1 hypothetical protein FC39_GL000084 [Lactobacillus hamsteri DSM 5661 = JCM 6256]
MSEKLIQFKVPEEIKDKLDKMFNSDGTTTPQGFRILAFQLAKMNQSPFAYYFENYSEKVNNRIKQELRDDELKELGILPDDAEEYNSDEEIRKAFKKHFGE